MQTAGDLEGAILSYHASIESFPTAEAYTFLGWAHSINNSPYEAIEACKTAIKIDPDFGNPYNDIGAYLMAMNREEEAVLWIEKAKQARRYEARHYPYFNMGRIYEKAGRWMEARDEFSAAVSIAPNYHAAKEALTRIDTMLARRN